jgi:uncharacterized repeat protein (TIGR01451 family)
MIGRHTGLAGLRFLGAAGLVWAAAVGEATADPRCAAVATGGTVTLISLGGDTYCVARFDTPGAFNFDLLSARVVEYLLVAGGGGGGAYAGGGGGGGGMRMGAVSLAPGSSTIVVGAGGVGDNRTGWPTAPVNGGGNGQPSSAFGIEALGGGGGGTYNSGTPFWQGRAGGSGGGGSHTATGGAGTAGQGFAGASGAIGCGNSSGGGGGGAGQPGFNGTVDIAGRGGDGLASSITGTAVVYGGGGAGGGDRRNTSCGDSGVPGVLANVGGQGGGGASRNDVVAGNSGVNGLGGGGAGGNVRFSGDASRGGDGGSGVVILRYVINSAPTANAGPDQTVAAFSPVTLDGTGSTDPDTNIVSYAWTQTSGTAVTLTDSATAQPSFSAPQPAGGAPSETLIFQLTVTDDFGLTSTDTVTITLQAVSALSTTKAVTIFSEDGSLCDNLGAPPPDPGGLTPAAIPGACIAYVISLQNTGTVAAQGVDLLDVLPATLTLQAATRGGWVETAPAPDSFEFNAGCSGGICSVEVRNGIIPAGQTATITIRATIN